MHILRCHYLAYYRWGMMLLHQLFGSEPLSKSSKSFLVLLQDFYPLRICEQIRHHSLDYRDSISCRIPSIHTLARLRSWAVPSKERSICQGRIRCSCHGRINTQISHTAIKHTTSRLSLHRSPKSEPGDSRTHVGYPITRRWAVASLMENSV